MCKKMNFMCMLSAWREFVIIDNGYTGEFHAFFLKKNHFPFVTTAYVYASFRTNILSSFWKMRIG